MNSYRLEYWNKRYGTQRPRRHAGSRNTEVNNCEVCILIGKTQALCNFCPGKRLTNVPR